MSLRCHHLILNKIRAVHIKCSRSWSHGSKPAVILKVNQCLVKYKHLTDDSDSRALQTAQHGDSLLCNVASLREGPAGSPCVTSLSFLCVAWLGYQRPLAINECDRVCQCVACDWWPAQRVSLSLTHSARWDRICDEYASWAGRDEDSTGWGAEMDIMLALL